MLLSGAQIARAREIEIPAIAGFDPRLLDIKHSMEYWRQRVQELLKAETASGMQAALNSLK